MTSAPPPVFSPDGLWMWTGSQWIPAPPRHDPRQQLPTEVQASGQPEQPRGGSQDRTPTGTAHAEQAQGQVLVPVQSDSRADAQSVPSLGQQQAQAEAQARLRRPTGFVPSATQPTKVSRRRTVWAVVAGTVTATVLSTVVAVALDDRPAGLAGLAAEVAELPAYRTWEVLETTATTEQGWDLGGVRPPVKTFDVTRPSGVPGDVGVDLSRTVRLLAWPDRNDAEAFAAGFASDPYVFVHRCRLREERYRAVVAPISAVSADLRELVSISDNC